MKSTDTGKSANGQMRAEHVARNMLRRLPAGALRESSSCDDVDVEWPAIDVCRAVMT